MADSKQYWIDRSLRNEKRSNSKATDITKKARKHYEKAAKEIEQQIAVFYARYANEQGFSYAEAMKTLNSKEAKEWRKSLEAYVDEINALPEGDLKAKLKAELDARAYASRISRLDALKAQIDMEVDRLMYNAENDLEDGLAGVYTDEYYRKMFDIQQHAGVMFDFAHLDAEMVESVLHYPWSGADFSSRVWENKRALLFHLRETLTQSVIQGKGVVMTSKALADKLGSSYAAAERLIRTESNRVHNDADKGAYSAAGVEYYEFVATLDSRTSKTCANWDGEIIPIDEAQTGVNYPPLHPWCRSTTVEHDPDEWKDWEAVGQPMPKRMTYKEWAKEQGLDVGDNDEVLAKPAKSGIEKLTTRQRVEAIKDRIKTNGGTMTEADVKEAGAIMRAELEKNPNLEKRAAAIGDSYQRTCEYAKQCNAINARLNKLHGSAWDDLKKEWDEAYAQYKIANEEYQNASRARFYDNAKDVKNLFADVREMGSDGLDVAGHLNNSRSTVRKSIEEAYNVYPRDWVEASIKRGKLTPKSVKRGYYNDYKREIAISGEGAQAFKVAVHEFGHRMERALPNILKHEAEFYARRTAGEELKRLGGLYKADEVTRFDQFLDPYIGKDYKGACYELVSMGFEMAYTRPDELLKDQDMAEWILGLLAIG